MISMRSPCEQLEIDTKDLCLLCLGARIGPNCIDSPPPIVPSSQGFKRLLRYLNVSPKKLFNCSSEFLQSMEIREDIDLKISLCSQCSSVTEKFNKLYQQYELIQLQFGDCVQSLHQYINQGNDNPERVRKYKDQMRPTKSCDLVNASIAANLRNETLRKCFLKLQLGTPRVRVALQTSRSDSKTRDIGTGCSIGSETKVLEYEANLELESHSFKNAGTGVPGPEEPESCLRRTRLMQRSTKAISGSIKLQSGTPRVRAASENPDVENCLKLPKLGAGCFISTDADVLEHNVNLGPFQIKNSVKSMNQSIIHKFGNDKQTPEPEPQGSLKETRFSQKTTKAISDTEILTPTPVILKPNTSQKKGYFNCIRQKLKTKPKQPAIATTPTITPAQQLFHDCSTSTDKINCDYCFLKFDSRSSLREHLVVVHPEHDISQFLPSDVSLELCKQGIDAVWEEMFVSSPKQCQFCMRELRHKASVKRHIISCHAELFAVKVFEKIQSLPLPNVALEVISTDAGNNYTNITMHTDDDAVQTNFVCEYCNDTYTTRIRLKHHHLYRHPEHIVYTFVSQNISLDSCRRGVYVVLEQMCNQTSESGFNCKFCTKVTVSKEDFKRHVLSMHARNIALEVQECIGIVPDFLEGISRNGMEDKNESYNDRSLPIEMDFEIGEESFIKLENPPLENVDFDPLGVDYD